jgi:hypothetical protein
MAILILFDGIAISNTSVVSPVMLVVDPRYYVAAVPETRKIAAQPEIRSIKG